MNNCKKAINQMNYDLIQNEERNKDILNEKNLVKKENFALKNKINCIKIIRVPRENHIS